MALRSRTWWSARLGLAIVGLVLPAAFLAAGHSQRAGNQSAPIGESVEMFAAIQKGQIEVQLVPKDSTECTVRIKNKTDKPLSVKLPDAYAGVPVLAQRGGGAAGGEPGGGPSSGGGRGGRGGAYGGGGGMQGFGGGMGGGMMGGMGGGMMGGMGGGFFNVAPEKAGSLKTPIVCLDHGKDDPRPTAKYQIKPIDQYTDKPAVQEVCRMLGTGVPQRVAQVAAWHLNNNMSWEQLAAKQIRHATGTREPYFAAREIQAAMSLVSSANSLAEQRKSDADPQKSISQTASDSQSRNTPN